MLELSPAAQAILDASTKVFWRPLIDVPAFQSKSVAAALRAAAEQVAPEDYSSYTGHTEHDFAMEARNDSVREAILAIADELEAH